jgi:hypothetical protein
MDESNTKKYINNTINYTINKKINCYSDKIDTMMKKIDDNYELSNKIIQLLEKNINLEKKVNELENIIKNMNSESNIKKNLTSLSCNNLENIDKKDKKSNYIHLLQKNNSLNNIENIDLELVLQNSPSKENIKNSPSKDDIKNSSFYKELKRESFDLDENFIKKCLSNASLNDDIKMFKKMYIDDVSKEHYPIRHMKKKLQYWCEGHMIDDDTNGTYIKNTILKNIEECYFKVNQYDNYTNDIEQFLKNQEHINKLSEQKYKDKFLQKIIQIISI